MIWCKTTTWCDQYSLRLALTTYFSRQNMCLKDQLSRSVVRSILCGVFRSSVLGVSYGAVFEMCLKEQSLKCVVRSILWGVSSGAVFGVCLKELSLRCVLRSSRWNMSWESFLEMWIEAFSRCLRCVLRAVCEMCLGESVLHCVAMCCRL